MGVAHQYCGSVGKKANCQVSVPIAFSNGDAAAPVAARLFLPRAWINDEQRRRRTGIPEEVVFRSKPEIALELVRELIGAGRMISDLDEDSGEIPETWLVFDWPQGQTEPYHIYTAWLDGPPERISLLRLSRQRFQIGQYFQRDKDDLGLEHFEGRSRRGFHHHLSLAVTAHLFVLLVFLRAKKLHPSRGKRGSDGSGHS